MTRVFATLLIAAATLFAGLLSASQAADYPPLYRDLGLPEYPQGKVTAVGRDNSNLADGISVKLQTAASQGELRAFYEEKMAALGWVLQETPAMKKMRKAGMLDKLPFRAAFCKSDGTVFQVSAQNLGASRQVSIAVNKGSNSCK